MRRARFLRSRKIVVFLLIAGLVCTGVSVAIAAEGTAFKDPYSGGIKLPEGGGEPGNAYLAFIKAAYRKDHREICRLMAEPAELDGCLQQKEALNGFIAMFTQPKEHKVLGGFMKGDEATLNMAYTFASAPPSTGFVVMKKTRGKWIVSSSGGSGSGTISAEASGQADLGATSASAPAAPGGMPAEFAIISISPNTKEYTGRCPATITFTANMTFRMPLPESFSYHWEMSDGKKTKDRVVKPPRTGHMSLREVWRGGKPGEERTASVRFVAEAGGAMMVLDPPGVRVVCK